MNNNLEILLEKITIQANLVDSFTQRSDLRFKSIYSLVLHYGKPFIKRVKSPFLGNPKGCYQNCYEALSRYPNLEYSEGYAIEDNLPIAVTHAWLVNQNGEVIDPTWNNKDSKTAVYFGIVFNRDYVQDMYAKNKSFSILENHYLRDHELVRDGFPSNALHPKFHI